MKLYNFFMRFFSQPFDTILFVNIILKLTQINNWDWGNMNWIIVLWPCWVAFIIGLIARIDNIRINK